MVKWIVTWKWNINIHQWEIKIRHLEKWIIHIMEQLNKEEHITFIFATHDQRVMDKARRVVSLDDGKVISDVVKS